MSINAVLTEREKADAFDALAEALTNQWHDGQWSWWCACPPGGPRRRTRPEAVADLIAWAKRQKPKKARPELIPLELVADDRKAT